MFVKSILEKFCSILYVLVDNAVTVTFQVDGSLTESCCSVSVCDCHLSQDSLILQVLLVFSYFHLLFLFAIRVICYYMSITVDLG
jgi:hypothetical protein